MTEFCQRLMELRICYGNSATRLDLHLDQALSEEAGNLDNFRLPLIFQTRRA